MLKRLILLFSICHLLSTVSAISTVTLHETKYPKSFVKSHRDLIHPEGLAFGPEGELYFTDFESNLIFKYEPGSEVEVFVGNVHGEMSIVGFRESANIFQPSGIILGKDGYLYVAATGSHVIAKISLKGNVSVLAGKLDQYSYRDGSCADARFHFPYGVAESLDGSMIYVSEQWWQRGIGNNVIRSINRTSCQVQTVAGSPDTTGFKDGPGSKALFETIYHIATHPITGDIYISDLFNHAIRVFSPISGNVSTLAGKGTNGYKDGRISDALFDGPTGIVIDRQGTVYVSEYSNNAIRTISSNGIVATLSGGDVEGFYDGLRKDAQLRLPAGLALDKDQMILFVADNLNSAIRMVGTQSGNTGTVAVREGSGDDDGFGAFASFSRPTFITADSSGNIFVSDSYNSQIRVILALSGEVKTVAGLRITGLDNGWKDKATFNGPHGIVFVASNLFVCDAGNHVIRVINASGYVSTFAGSGKLGWRDGYGIDAAFNYPIGITSDSSRSLFVAEYYGCAIRKITPDGYVSFYAGTGECSYRDGPASKALFFHPSGIVFNKQDGALYVTDYFIPKIRRISSDGLVSTLAGSGEIGDIDGQGSKARFFYLRQISLGPDGNLYVADSFNHKIRQITTSGNVSSVAGNSANPSMRIGTLFNARFRDVYGVFADPHSHSLIVADSANNGIRNITLSSGKVESIAGYGSSVYLNGQIGDSYVKNPSGIAFDPMNGIIYYSNTDRNVISSVSINSGLGASRYAGSGNTGWYDSLSSREAHFNGPQGLEFVSINDSYSFLLVADTGNDIIRKINLIDGSVYTVAGNGDNGFVILSPLKSSFNSPRDIAFDIKESCIYVADSGNHVIRRVRESSKEPTQLIAGNRIAGYLDGFWAKSMFNQPSGLALLLDGSLLISDTYNHCIRKWNKTSRMVSTFAGTPGEDGFDEVRMNLPIGIAVSKSSGIVYVADSGNNAIRVISFNGALQTLALNDLQVPTAIAFDSDENLLITDTKNNAIKKIILFSSETRVESQTGLGVGAVIGIAIGVAFTVGIASLMLMRRWRSSLKMKNNVSVLMAISKKEQRSVDKGKNDATDGATLSPSKSVAIALPGFLKLDLGKSVRMETPIKRGGTAQVCKAQLKDSALIEKHKEVEVAVKVFPDSKDPELIACFNYEVALMAAIPASPYLVKIIGYSVNPRSIVMKYYGLSMTDCLKQPKFFSNGQITIKAAVEIATGMNLLHQKEIIHFDLKPDNVMVDFKPQSNEMFFVVCDFGFSNFTADSNRQTVAGMKKPTSAGLTTRYAAPELFQKIRITNSRFDSQLDKKIDVFAYGMTLYWLAAGKKPWSEISDADEIERLVVAGERPKFDAEEESNEVKKLLQGVAVKCCLQDPKDRPSFEEILSELTLL